MSAAFSWKEREDPLGGRGAMESAPGEDAGSGRAPDLGPRVGDSQGWPTQIGQKGSGIEGFVSID